MDSFDSIFQRAAKRKGGEAALEEILPKAASDRTLKARPDSFQGVSGQFTGVNAILIQNFAWTRLEISR